MISAKDLLRKRIKSEHNNYTPHEKLMWSEFICDKLQNIITSNNVSVVFAFNPLPDEVDIWPLVKWIKLNTDIKILLPKVVSDTEMTWHEYSDEQSLKIGRWNIYEPTTETIDINKYVNPENVIAIIPGMAFSKTGERLGRGKGYYDRFLAQHPCIYKIGVCWPFQMVEDLPTNKNDVIMNKVITSSIC